MAEVVKLLIAGLILYAVVEVVCETIVQIKKINRSEPGECRKIDQRADVQNKLNNK